MKLFKHQQDIVDQFPQRHALVWETGTGKSLAAIALAKKTKCVPLIIVPKALKSNWRATVAREKLTALVITKEEFRRDWNKLGKYDTVVVDEAHYFFGTKSDMKKSLQKYLLKHSVKYRYFLTATPYRSTPMDIYVMALLLGQPMNYPEFFRRFFIEIRMGMRYIPQPRKGIEGEIAGIVKRLGSIVRLDECADVPEQTFEVEYFELTNEQKKAISELVVFLPIVRYTKVHSICGGTLRGDEYNEPQEFKADKMDRLKELVASNPRVIVVCRYNHEIEILSKMFENSRVINGEVAGDDRHEILKSLQKSDNYVLIVNAACSEGWQLPGCPLMVFYSLDFSLKNFLQMKGRILRIDALKKNTYIFLVVKETIDEDIYNCITVKKMDFHVEIYKKENRPLFPRNEEHAIS
jgi:superfamily II DNA or RNA helicase